MTLAGEIERLVAEGFELAQEGAVTEPLADTFSGRCVGFRIGLLGTFAPPTYRSEFENRLLDDGQRWAHLRRRRSG